MKKLILFLSALLFSSVARASFVSAGSTNAVNGVTSTACVPNGGGVTSGDVEVIAVITNSIPNVSSVSSTRVPTWITDGQHGANLIMYYGVSTSSGSETITATLSGSNTHVGSVCGEYTTNTQNVATGNTNTSISVTTTQAVTDIVVALQGILGVTNPGTTFTTRATCTDGGTPTLILADASETSTGTYTQSFTGGSWAAKAFYTPPPVVTNKIPPIMN